MNSVTKIAMGMIGVAAIATAVLPGRQTPAVLTGVTRLFTGSLSTAEGTSSGAVG
jgi:hypothetical protein